jgi:hypothetical protein
MNDGICFLTVLYYLFYGAATALARNQDMMKMMWEFSLHPISMIRIWRKAY